MDTVKDVVPASGALRGRGNLPVPRPDDLGASGSLVDHQRRKEDIERWERFIYEQLVEWGRDPSALAEEDIKPPTVDMIGFACKLAKACMNAGLPAPTRIVPDGSGGIVFERHDGLTYEAVMIYVDYKVELVLFHNGVLQSRKRLDD